MNTKTSNIITTVTFCLLIGALTVASMVNPVREYSQTENRTLAQAPTFTLDALFNGSFTADYEEFITDQFVARDSWITLKNYAELALGKKESNGVYFADDGYLIENHEYDSATLEANIGYVKKFIDAAGEDYNVRVLIAPTASLILRDKLPTGAPIWDQAGLLDRMSELDGFVDCRDILSKHTDEYIYYRTDHHWTTLGSYYAYRELCASFGITPLELTELTKRPLSDEFYGTLAAKVNLPTDPDELYALETELKLTVNYNMGQKITDTLYETSHLETRSKYSTFLNENQPMVEITTENKNGRTLLLIKDSYSHCMVPMLVNHYERVLLLDLRALTGGVISNFIPLLESGGDKIDDIAVLYNAENFTEDKYLVQLAK